MNFLLRKAVVFLKPSFDLYVDVGLLFAGNSDLGQGEVAHGPADLGQESLS